MDSGGLMSPPPTVSAHLLRPARWDTERRAVCLCACMRLCWLAQYCFFASFFLKKCFVKGKNARKMRRLTCFAYSAQWVFFSFFFLLTQFFALRLPGVYLGGGVEPCVKNIPTVNYKCAGLRARAPPCASLLYDGELWISRAAAGASGPMRAPGTRGQKRRDVGNDDVG